MPLTPQDVRAKLFTSVRFKHGYDEDEVDAFLDQVEGDLGVLYGQIDGLKAELAAAQTRLVRAEEVAAPSPVLEPDTGVFAPVGEVPLPSSVGHAPAPAAPGGVEPVQESSPAPSPPDVPEAAADETDEKTSVFVGSAGDPVEDGAVEATAGVEAPATGGPSADVAVPAGTAVAPAEDSPTEEMLRRTLILAQRTADALIVEARTEAETLVADARAQAEQIERAAATEHASRQRDRQAEHDHLNGLVEQLRSFETEYRSRLRAYLHLQLRDLENSTPAEPQQQIGSHGQYAALQGGQGEEPGEPAGYGVAASESQF